MICGKIASGKSTLAATLGDQSATVVICEDDWLSAFYSEQMTSMADYIRCMGRLRGIMAPHIVSLLKSGVSVVLDFQANTVESRNWMRGIFEQAQAGHLLHVLEVADDVCIARLNARSYVFIKKRERPM